MANQPGTNNTVTVNVGELSNAFALAVQQASQTATSSTSPAGPCHSQQEHAPTPQILGFVRMQT